MSRSRYTRGLALALGLACTTSSGAAGSNTGAAVGDGSAPAADLSPPPTASTAPGPEASMRGPLTQAAGVAAVDGQVVTVLGTYQKKMTLKGMPRPGRPPEVDWLGAVEIRISGVATDLDPTAPDGEPATLDLGDGPRPEAEVSAWEGKQVRVRGKVSLRPASDPTFAGPRPGPRITPVDPITSGD